MKRFCFRCRKYKERESFQIIRHHGDVYKVSRNCGECHLIKTDLMAKHAKRFRIFRPCETRERELALIPNPFKKNIIPSGLIHPLLWTGNA
jgi:hypothetical protein